MQHALYRQIRNMPETVLPTCANSICIVVDMDKNVIENVIIRAMENNGYGNTDGAELAT